MFSNKKIMQKTKHVFFILAICSFVFSFATDVFANEIASEPGTAIITSEKTTEEKIQVRYQVRYIDENQNEIDFSRTKIGFLGEEVSERAIPIANHEPISPREQKLVLAKESNFIVFEYRSIDAVKLERLKQDALHQIEQLSRISLREKNSAKSEIQDAKNEAQVLLILEEVKKLDDNTKV